MEGQETGKLRSFLKELDDLNLPLGEYVITSSGVLAVRGIREAADLDILVSDRLWQDLVLKYKVEKGELCDSIYLGNLHLMGNWHSKDRLYSTQEQIEGADIIDGHPYLNLNMLKEFKEKSGREKDKKDIELISLYRQSKL